MSLMILIREFLIWIWVNFCFRFLGIDFIFLPAFFGVVCESLCENSVCKKWEFMLYWWVKGR